MDLSSASPDLSTLSAELARRVRMTISCRDSDDLRKVDHAGEVLQQQGRSVQVMHNGILIEEGCYYGPWMSRRVHQL